MNENSWWLSDYALFMAVKGRFDNVEWTKWAEDIRLRWKWAMDYYREELYYDIEFQQYMQFKFHDQLDEENVPTAVAGCPPDGFSATGQLWGNPLYRWDYHRETGYAWWISRLHYVFQMYDVVRIDHFRGFDEYFSIPHGAENAIGGHWAEDLGYVTDSVREMVRESGFPGMKVLEFAFDSRDSGCANDYLPHNYPVNSVAYTGTHDNETIVGWWSSITKEEQKLARDYMCDQYTPESELYKSLISLIMRSSAKLCVIPMQDYLGLGNNCRINTPSTVGKNWKWRVNSRQLSLKLQKEIYDMALRYGRMNWETVE